MLICKTKKNEPNKPPERKFLIPYNKGLSHWVEIYIHIEGQVVKMHYLDPLDAPPTNPLGRKIAENETNVPAEINKHIKTIYPQAEIQKAFYYNQSAETAKTSCGVLTVENLVAAACYPTSDDIQEFRRKHVELMQEEGADPDFYARQRDNCSTVADSSQQWSHLTRDDTIHLSQAEQAGLKNFKQAIVQLTPAHQHVLVTALQQLLSSAPDVHRQYLDGMRQAVAYLFQAIQNTAASSAQEVFGTLIYAFLAVRLKLTLLLVRRILKSLTKSYNC